MKLQLLVSHGRHTYIYLPLSQMNCVSQSQKGKWQRYLMLIWVLAQIWRLCFGLLQYI